MDISENSHYGGSITVGMAGPWSSLVEVDVSYCVYNKLKKLCTTRTHGIIPSMFDYLSDLPVHLLLPKSSMAGLLFDWFVWIHVRIQSSLLNTGRVTST